MCGAQLDQTDSGLADSVDASEPSAAGAASSLRLRSTPPRKGGAILSWAILRTGWFPRIWKWFEAHDISPVPDLSKCKDPVVVENRLHSLGANHSDFTAVAGYGPQGPAQA